MHISAIILVGDQANVTKGEAMTKAITVSKTSCTDRTKCEHNDYDDYFERCSACGMSAINIAAEKLSDRLQQIYAGLLEDTNASADDLDPPTADALHKAERQLASVIVDWTGLA